MATGDFIRHHGQDFYNLDDVRDMPEFFMTLVSSSDQWMFLSSKGALTAGRIDPEHALFPYNTVDKVCAGRNHTGPKTLIRVNGGKQIWEPFADWTPQLWNTTQGLARNCAGSRVIFSEKNNDLGLEFSYSWAFSRRYGFVRNATLRNLTKKPIQVEVLDGLLNLVSPGVSRQQITEFSCLIDAYKDNVVAPEADLAIYSLSSLVTDKAEAAEALEASIAWYHGSGPVEISLDRNSLQDFSNGKTFVPQSRARGMTNDFITKRSMVIQPDSPETWYIVADRGLDGSAVDHVIQELASIDFDAARILEKDIQTGEAKLHEMVAKADGLSWGDKPLQNWHHYSNVLFNIMRGGVPADSRQVNVADAVEFIRGRNFAAGSLAVTVLDGKSIMDFRDFLKLAETSGNTDLVRLGTEYLPLTFSRRHGDPSRPWNLFSIKIEDTQGNPVLNHQGNWRDIFQNWESLGLSYPDYVPGFMATFLNATTLDGYNPYRVTRDGADWEKLEPHNPWSNIGYWSDHQIIYLQKLLEWTHEFQPGRLEKELGSSRYSYSSVPYRIADYVDICRDPKTTISFDFDMDERIEKQRAKEGNDARLVHDAKGAVYHGTLAEKILTLLLAKLGNLVPGGGIWMNTQRPEWNDANNALVGNGLSVVTLGHVRRFLVFWKELLSEMPPSSFVISQEVKELADGVNAVLSAYTHPLKTAQDPSLRRNFMDSMGEVCQKYRHHIYANFRFSGEIAHTTREALLALFNNALEHVDASLSLLKRPDGLFHSYNILILENANGKSQARIKPLSLMLEGQVSILGAHYLCPSAAADLFDAIRKSDLYRADQHSYILYPSRNLPDFRTKNRIDPQFGTKNPLLSALLAEKNTEIIISGYECLHFAAGLSNHRALDLALSKLSKNDTWTRLVAANASAVHALYESVFHHDEYTGRSGTMYAYEGIGSIYWHMVSKLLLAASENQATVPLGETALRSRLENVYLDIREGLGYRKDAAVYGAFPWEPYSHTPAGAGAKQPGMTGQVKEEIITRFAEYGLVVTKARLAFLAAPLMKDELGRENTTLEMPAVNGKKISAEIAKGFFACSICGIPVIRGADAVKSVEIVFHDGKTEQSGPVLSAEISDLIFSHAGVIKLIKAS